MAQKRAARRGRKTVAGSDDSVELGRNGEYRRAKKPSLEGVEGSQSDNVRKGSEATDEETAIRALAALAAARDAAAKPLASPKPAGGTSSKDSTSRRQEGMTKKLPPLEEEEEEEEKESEEESTEDPGPNSQPKRERASGRVTRSQQGNVPAPAQQQGKEGVQPSELKKLKSKKISRRQEGMMKKLPPSEKEEEEMESEEESTEAPGPNSQPKRKRASGRVTRSQQRKVPAPAQQQGKEGAQPSESKKLKSKKITLAPLQQQLSESEMPKSKKITPAPLQQQGEETAQPSESEMPKSKRIRRIWTPSDEVQILKALVEHRREQGKLPAPDNNDFFDSIAKRLEDKSCNRFHIKDKVRSLMRRYKSYVVPTTDHEKRLDDLSNSVWGDLRATHTAKGSNGDGEQEEGEHSMSEAENGGGQTLDKSFEEMCEMYPLLGQEVKRLTGVQPALRSSFTGLDGKKALLMETKLGKLKWKELKIQVEMEARVEAPKARIRKELVNFLSEVSKKL